MKIQKKYGLALVVATALYSQALTAAPQDVLATIGTKTITVQDLENRIKAFPPQYAEALKSKDTREKLLDQMIDEQIVLNAAQKSGIDKSKNFKAQIDAARTQILVSTYLRESIEDKVLVSNDEVNEYYKNNPQQFQETELRRASHILVKTEDEAKAIQQSLRNGGDFAKIAKEKSIDTGSGANGGDLGFFRKGQMVPEFEKAAYDLKKDATSDIVKTQFGFHIIRLAEIQVRPKIELTDETKAQIKEALTNEKKRALLADRLEKLRKENKVKKDTSKL
jgi:peptidyl-prolyl cis-trans isomerase C